MTLKWQDRLGAVAGLIKTNWKALLGGFVGGLIVGGLLF